MLSRIKKLIPKKLFRILQPIYHYKLALLGALFYGFPSRSLTVIGITGTKGKSTTTELISAIFEAAGKKTAVVGTIRFKIGEATTKNLFKMTTPGRLFLHRFLRRAVSAGCTHAILEISSEAARQYRHKFLNLDVLVFLNLSPEHIESHGGYDNYVSAKLSIANELAHSSKKRTVLIANKEDKETPRFMSREATEKITFSARDGEPYSLDQDSHVSFTFKGVRINTKLRGMFNLYNTLAAATCASAFGIDSRTIKHALENITSIPGRVQSIDAGQPFEVIVDYAHTADSLTKLYEAFANKRIIGILGNTGGGRDTWKRPEMAKVADTYCDHIILTNEDPYDEDPKKIIDAMLPGITETPYEVIMDRRTAIHKALTMARHGDAVLITGKGTDPYIMGPHDTKEVWSDADVAREELEKLLKNK